MAQDRDLPATAPPREPIPPVTPADRAAAFPDVAGHAVHDKSVHSFWLLDRLEVWDADEERTGVGWEALSWIGTDVNRVWLRSEGERSEEHTSELQSLMRISYAVFCLKKQTYINVCTPYNRQLNNLN